MTTDPGPAPWDDPSMVIPVKPKRRGPTKAKPATEASRKWVYRPPRITEDTVELIDCPRCEVLVLAGVSDGHWRATWDIWQVPYADACVLSRYGVPLFRMIGLARNQASSWHPLNRESAIRIHDCQNKWWQRGPYIGFKNSYIGDDVYL